MFVCVKLSRWNGDGLALQSGSTIEVEKWEIPLLLKEASAGQRDTVYDPWEEVLG